MAAGELAVYGHCGQQDACWLYNVIERLQRRAGVEHELQAMCEDHAIKRGARQVIRFGQINKKSGVTVVFVRDIGYVSVNYAVAAVAAGVCGIAEFQHTASNVFGILRLIAG